MLNINPDLNIRKINEPIQVRYLAKERESGLTDLYFVATQPDGTDLSPILLSEVTSGLYEGSFTPNLIGYWYGRVSSVSSPENTNMKLWFVVENYPTWVTTSTAYLTDFQYSEDNTESSTTATTTQNKLTYNFTPDVDTTGEYIIEWYFELANSNGKPDLYTVQLNGNNLAFAEENISLDYVDNGWKAISGFKKETLDINQQTITINFWASASTAYIKNARLKIYRVG